MPWQRFLDVKLLRSLHGNSRIDDDIHIAYWTFMIVAAIAFGYVWFMVAERFSQSTCQCLVGSDDDVPSAAVDDSDPGS